MPDKIELQNIASELRARIIENSHKTSTPHLGSCLSCIDILVAIYFSVLRIDPKAPKALERDRFIMSKGHGAPALLHVLAMKGFSPSRCLRHTDKMVESLASILTRQIIWQA